MPSRKWLEVRDRHGRNREGENEEEVTPVRVFKTGNKKGEIRSRKSLGQVETQAQRNTS